MMSEDRVQLQHYVKTFWSYESRKILDHLNNYSLFKEYSIHCTEGKYHCFLREHKLSFKFRHTDC